MVTAILASPTPRSTDDSKERASARALARFALDEVHDEGQRKVLPLCPFIKGWIGRHREYVPMVYGIPESTAKD